MLLLSVCGILAYLIAPLRGAQDAVLTNTLLASVVALGLIYGALILSLSLDGLRSRSPRRVSLPPALFFVAIFALVIGAGQATLSANLAPAYLFPPWHVLASGMVPLAVIAYAVRRLPPISSPSLVGELTWGGIGTVLLALVFELIVVAALVVAVVLVLALVLGPEGLQQLVAQLRPYLNRPADLEGAVRVVLSKPAVLITVGTAAVAFFSLLVPLIEETLKSLGPAVTIGMTKPPLTRALLWGIAAGAGYAFSENLLNGATGATGAAGGGMMWAVPMTLRAGTSLVHIATTATISLGWYMALVRGQRARFLLYYAAGVAAHGLWNFISVIATAALTSVSLSSNLTGSDLQSAVLESIVALILGIMIAGAGLWIAWLIRWAKRAENQMIASSGTPHGDRLDARVPGPSQPQMRQP
jgi:PrsW family intramembrane metalloprotease